MNIADSLNSLIKKAADTKAALRAEMQTAFKKAVTAFFAKAPKGTTITWSQYTPYFNDGEPCLFQTGSTELRFKPLEGEDKERMKEYGMDEDGYCYGDVDQTAELPAELQPDAEALSTFIYSQCDLMLHLYGDHKLIRLSKSGTEISDYNHD